MSRYSMKRTDTLPGYQDIQTRRQTPHPLRTPLAPKPNIGKPTVIQRFGNLDADDDDEEEEEEVEEPIESGPATEAEVKAEKKTPVGRKRKLIGQSSSTIIAIPPGPSRLFEKSTTDPQPATSDPTRTVKPRASRSRQTKSKVEPIRDIPSEPFFQGPIPTTIQSSKSIETANPLTSINPVKTGSQIPSIALETPILTPHRKLKISVPPSAPKKTLPVRPIKGSKSNGKDESPKKPKSKLGNQVGPQLDPPLPNANLAADDHKLDPAPVPKSDEVVGNGNRIEGFFEPNGEIRDIYVQGSKMIVKVKVEKSVYVDGSTSDYSEEIAAHIAFTLQHFMVPYLHKLTFRHTGQMEAEYYLKDSPIVYHIQQVQHGLGNKFTRSSKVECLMWEELVIITPYLVPGPVNGDVDVQR